VLLDFTAVLSERVFLAVGFCNKAIRIFELKFRTNCDYDIVQVFCQTLGPTLFLYARLAKAGKIPCSHLVEQAPSRVFSCGQYCPYQGPWYAPRSQNWPGDASCGHLIPIIHDFQPQWQHYSTKIFPDCSLSQRKLINA
jgi:hypothetical protein